MKNLLLLCLTIIFFGQYNIVSAQKVDKSLYEYKEVKDFPLLSTYNSVEEFDQYYQKYNQDCLDNTFGGLGGIPCFIEYELWDRELNIYYQKLYSILNAEQKSKLKESQISWLKTRDLSQELTLDIIHQKYTMNGTMYKLMAAGEQEDLAAPIVRERTLTLKNWFESISNPNE